MIRLNFDLVCLILTRTRWLCSRWPDASLCRPCWGRLRAQGLSVGGQFVGAIIMMIEVAPPGQSYFLGGCGFAGAVAGTAVGSAVAGVRVCGGASRGSPAALIVVVVRALCFAMTTQTMTTRF